MGRGIMLVLEALCQIFGPVHHIQALFSRSPDTKGCYNLPHSIGKIDGKKTCVPRLCSPNTPVLDKGKQLTSHKGYVASHGSFVSEKL